MATKQTYIDANFPQQPVGTSADASGGKYDVSMLTYPTDLFGNGASQYGKSWVMININVQKNTANAESYAYVDLTEAEKRRYDDTRLRGDTVAGAVSRSVAVTGGAAVIGSAVSGGGKKLMNLLSPGTRTGAIIELASAGVKGGAAGAAAALPIMLSGTATRETKRIAAAIQLPMPNNLATAYSADWGEVDTRIFDLAMRLPSAAAESVTTLFSDKQLLDAGASAALAAAGAFGGGSAGVAAGLASNPKKELMFNNMGFRNFTLEYKFFPRDEQEAYQIKRILQTMKYHMHPEYLSSGRFTYVYPSEFDITFYNSDGNESVWINKIATCVLQNMSINYTPDGTWAAHEGGSPTAMQVAMTFKELSILTKELIDKGF